MLSLSPSLHNWISWKNSCVRHAGDRGRHFYEEKTINQRSRNEQGDSMLGAASAPGWEGVATGQWCKLRQGWGKLRDGRESWAGGSPCSWWSIHDQTHFWTRVYSWQNIERRTDILHNPLAKFRMWANLCFFLLLIPSWEGMVQKDWSLGKKAEILSTSALNLFLAGPSATI